MGSTGARGGGAPERGARRTGGSVHVRNTSRVTSPTPRGDQKQNWRVRSLISSPRERTSPGRRCGAALSRSGATTGGCRAGRGSGARSRARSFAAEKRTSRSTRGAAESRAAGVSTAARTVEGGEARPGKSERRRRPQHEKIGEEFRSPARFQQQNLASRRSHHEKASSPRRRSPFLSSPVRVARLGTSARLTMRSAAPLSLIHI